MSTFEKLVDAIGRQGAEKLIAEFGGRRIYVPVLVVPDSPIACAIGTGAAAKLSRAFGGDRIDLPVLTLRSRVAALHAAGKSVAEIAIQLSCTRRWVRRVIAIAGINSPVQPRRANH